MRAEFAAWATTYAQRNERFVFLTGDLGYKALESLREAMGARFINAGVAEQNMVTLAAGLAREGMQPMVYSIAPFAVFRPAEQTRVDVCLHRLDVKIVGNGGGYGYGIMGATHHALEDLAVMSSFPDMQCYVPEFNSEVAPAADAMMSRSGPAYLRLGYAQAPANFTAAYAPIRLWGATEMRGIETRTRPGLTVLACGPVLAACQAAIEAETLQGCVDLFSASQLPLLELNAELRTSLGQSKRLLVVEEHVSRGGVGENISKLVLESGLPLRLRHLHALGYPDGTYGSQAYHLKQSGLDANSIASAMRDLIFSEQRATTNV